MLKQIAITLLFSGSLAAQTGPPQRKVEGSTVVSTQDPAVKIRLPISSRYVGADRWILYSMDDCELHTFVQADSQKNIQRLYWVQFESYLPTRPELHHTYDSPRHTQIGGLDFYLDTWAEPTTEGIKPGSDVEHLYTLLRTHGYKLPPGMMSVRLVHLLDQQKRKELMIIYSENLAPTGFTVPDLHPGGRASDQWPQIEKDLIDRAEKSIAIEQPPHHKPDAPRVP
jgi:hypothetical protein